MKYILMTICALMVFASSAHAEKVTIVADNWCPYNCAPDDKQPGFIVEIVQKAFAKHGIEIEYQTMPWPRAIEEARSGHFTAVVGASKVDALDFIFPTTEQGLAKHSFFVRKSNEWRYSGLESLEKITLRAIKGYTYGEPIDSYIAKHMRNMRQLQLTHGNNALELNVKKLLAGRVQAVLEDERVMWHHLRKSQLDDAIVNAGSIEMTETSKLFVAFSPFHPESEKYASILSSETDKMRRSGELEAILRRYQITDWRK